MKKRNLALIGLLVATVLLSGLALGIPARAGPPTVTKIEAVRIVAFDADRPQGVRSGFTWLPFEFNPKDNFLGATKAWVTFVGYHDTSEYKTLTVSLNKQPIFSRQIGYHALPKQYAFATVDSGILQTITPGINTLKIKVDKAGLWVCEVNVFIEYQYSIRKYP
jgi:hypothetical protein